MSEIKAKIVITLDESGIVHSEIKGQAKALSAMLATTMVREETKFLELIEISLELLEYHNDKQHENEAVDFIEAVKDILANHKPSKQ